MGKTVSAIANDGSIMCYAIDSTDIIYRAERLHRTSATVTAALGRLLTAASLMGCQLKGEKDSLTLKIKGGGPSGSLIAVSDSSGNVKGYPENPIVEIPLNAHGKLDVAGAVGKEGALYVMKDLGLKEPYIGHSPIVSGEIAEDITYYYAMSEQIPTVCALGVLVNPDLTVKAAGGFIAQLLPGAPEESIAILENNINSMLSVTQLLEQGKTPEQIALDVLSGLEPNLVSSFETAYKCDCSRERVEKALISLGTEELKEMAVDVKPTEVDCHFCNKKYRFNAKELTELALHCKR